jgi:hypothetical protein
MNVLRTTPMRAALVVAVVAALSAAGADASGRFKSRRFHAFLDGTQEVPALSTPATGEFRATLSADGSTLTYELTYSALEGGTPTASHVHIGQPGANGGVMFFLCGGGSKPACPDGPAIVTGQVMASDVNAPAAQGIDPGAWDEVIQAMRDGITYANIHSPKWTGGEIRGMVKN